MPRDSAAEGGDQSTGAAQPDGGTVAATDNTAPGKGLDNPLDPEGNREPLSKYKWWILGSLALLLVAAAGVMLRKPTGAPGTTTAPQAAASPLTVSPEAQNTQLLAALKEEIFALETDKLQGKLSEAEYTQTKAALELILGRALRRPAS